MPKNHELETALNFINKIDKNIFITSKNSFLHKTKYIYYFFLICILACKSENLDIKNPQIQTVKINGTSDEKGFNINITIQDDSLLYVTRFKDIKKEVNGDAITRTLQNIKNPKLLEFNSFGENTYYRTRIIVTPGDSVSYTLKNGKLEFTGKNQEHYNFYLEMDRDYDAWSKLYLNKYNPDFKKYKHQCDSLYNKRLTFFNNYVKNHPTVSEEFKKIIQNDLRLEYLVNVIRPRSEIQSSWSVNTIEDINSIYERADKQEGDFFDINGYLNNITLEDVNKPEYISYLYFQMSIVPLIRQYFVKSNEIPFSIASFKEELAFLKKNFDQSIVDYATGDLIRDYFNQGFGKDKNTAEFMKNTIKVYKESIKVASTIQTMEDIEQELNTTNKKLPKELNELVINLSKDTINFNYNLRQKKIKVIDFWASWCQPCIEEIIISKDKREQIASKYNVDFLYLSIDRDTQKWIDKSIDLYEFLPDIKQFKTIDFKKSKLIKFLNLRSSVGITIPRYVILDENNMIIDNNAPKPSKDNFESIISKISK
ncbi:TlpA family protein disulfide reductase [Polaribacter sp. Asnod6-C07]|uniref:TlpA family protein disulfide reductase n=1 Tax=Polaribacter sp. Asnod6-C07 TaxID=3160582 RepID=UPI0038681547